MFLVALCGEEVTGVNLHIYKGFVVVFVPCSWNKVDRGSKLWCSSTSFSAGRRVRSELDALLLLIELLVDLPDLGALGNPRAPALVDLELETWDLVELALEDLELTAPIGVSVLLCELFGLDLFSCVVRAPVDLSVFFPEFGRDLFPDDLELFAPD